VPTPVTLYRNSITPSAGPVPYTLIGRSRKLGIRIGIVSDNMPSETFQIFEEAEEASVAVSPFRLGELPNIRTGIATITTAPDAVNMYRAMIDRLWTDAAKGKEGAELLQNLLDRF
jgi:hypothetical protein